MPELFCYRASSYRTPVRSRRHGPDSAGRYHHPGSQATQYFSLHPLGPWAEVTRNQRCASVDDAMEIRVAIWVIRLVVADPPATIDFDAADSGRTLLPISPADLTHDDPTICRALAQAHRDDRSAPKILRVPSAALPGTENIVILGARRMIEYAIEPMRPIHVPAAVGAVDARPPRDLFRFVRRVGAPDPAFEAWRQGTAHEVPEIDTANL
jgi:RES domain-containing protein